MFVKASLATALMFIAGAHAQCPNSGVGIGREQLCNFSGHNVAGTWDQAAVKQNLAATGDGAQCGGYVGTRGFGNANVDCSGNTITGATPPNAGHYHCSSANIVKAGGFFSFATIVSCCQPD